MGFGKRRRLENKAQGGKRARADGDSRGGNWTLEGNQQNERFDAFYRAQGFVAEGEDWQSFLDHLRAPLPACFRINPNYAFKEKLQQELIAFSNQSLSAEASGSVRPSIEQIPWFAGGLAYKLGADRRAIRRTEGLESLHKWMIAHTENGNITRQEAVSMVPPLALNVQPHHRCLDMCAAPGSKTTQVLEIVGSRRGETDEEQGLVVANDADTDRAYMLVHQCRRLSTPLLVITTHKGQQFPSIRPTIAPGVVAKKGCFFDRVLCDVPCSGDGTLRKSPHIWPKWATGQGVDLHKLQLMIARRSLELLKPGGLMVYSTCSMSPYEDEAVVAELLRSNEDLELIDGREFLPLFRCRPGLSSWHVLDDARVPRKAVTQAPATAEGQTAEPEVVDDENKVIGDDPDDQAAEAEDGCAASNSVETNAAPTNDVSDAVRVCIDMGFRYFRTVDDVPVANEKLRKRFRKSLFSPSAEEAAWMHLERCLRCVPQDEDSGGFFVATLRKKEAQPTASEPDSTAVEVQPPEVTARAASESKGKPAKSYKGLNDYLVWDEESFNGVQAFYDLKGVDADAFYIREDFTKRSCGNSKKGSGANSKSVYYLPAVLREFLAGDVDNRVKCVSAGVKVLERKDRVGKGEPEYRLVQDGVEVMARHMAGGPRVIEVSAQDFCNLLGGGLVSFQTLSARSVLALTQISTGSLICEYNFNPADCVGGAQTEISGTYVFRVVCFRGTSRTVNVMCNKVEMDSLRHQLEALGVYRPKISASAAKLSATMALVADVGQSAAPASEDRGDSMIVTDDSERSNAISSSYVEADPQK